MSIIIEGAKLSRIQERAIIEALRGALTSVNAVKERTTVQTIGAAVIYDLLDVIEQDYKDPVDKEDNVPNLQEVKDAFNNKPLRDQLAHTLSLCELLAIKTKSMAGDAPSLMADQVLISISKARFSLSQSDL